jgi:hypothetical protein
MGGTSKTQSTTQQQQTTAPWAPAQPALTDILSSIQGQIPNYSPNATETAAGNTATANAQAIPNWAPQASDLTNSYFGGDPSGLLSPALQQYRDQLNPIANQNNDPLQTPGIQNLLATIRNDVGTSVNQQFAGAGRDLSGQNTQALARGIAQGEAAPLLGQYNTNVAAQTGAAGNLYNAAGQTAGALGANQAQGFNFAGAVPTLATQGPSAVLQAQAAMRGLPLNNLGMLENLTVPIAGLGGQQTGNSQSQGTQQMSGAQQFALIAGGLGGLFKCDRRTKKNIEMLREYDDGIKLYRWEYKHDGEQGVGFMADEIERVVPEANVDIFNIKHIDYSILASM